MEMSLFSFSSSYSPEKVLQRIDIYWVLNRTLCSFHICYEQACSVYNFLVHLFFFIIHSIFYSPQNSHLRLDFSLYWKSQQFKSFLIVFQFLCTFNRAVKFTSKLFGRALSRRIKATVLFASETGRSEQYAKQLVELLSHAFNAQVITVSLARKN